MLSDWLSCVSQETCLSPSEAIKSGVVDVDGRLAPANDDDCRLPDDEGVDRLTDDEEEDDSQSVVSAQDSAVEVHSV